MKTKEVEGALKLSDERKAEFSTAFSGIEDAPFGQLVLGLWTDRGSHLIAARARAIASDAGISLTRPLSMSLIRRSTSTAHASLMS